MTKKNGKRGDTTISLHPLKLREALKEIMESPPKAKPAGPRTRKAARSRPQDKKPRARRTRWR